jgi:hypothetical protein
MVGDRAGQRQHANPDQRSIGSDEAAAASNSPAADSAPRRAGKREGMQETSRPVRSGRASTAFFRFRPVPARRRAPSPGTRRRSGRRRLFFQRKAQMGRKNGLAAAAGARLRNRLSGCLRCGDFFRRSSIAVKGIVYKPFRDRDLAFTVSRAAKGLPPARRENVRFRMKAEDKVRRAVCVTSTAPPGARTRTVPCSAQSSTTRGIARRSLRARRGSSRSRGGFGRGSVADAAPDQHRAVPPRQEADRTEATKTAGGKFHSCPPFQKFGWSINFSESGKNW